MRCQDGGVAGSKREGAGSQEGCLPLVARMGCLPLAFLLLCLATTGHLAAKKGQQHRHTGLSTAFHTVTLAYVQPVVMSVIQPDGEALLV